MTGKVEKNDIKIIEEIAKKYNLSMADFCKLIIKETRTQSERQFRVSEDEYKVILDKARKHGMTVRGYCEYACCKFIKENRVDNYFFEFKKYGVGRNKRISILFKDSSLEKTIGEIAEKTNIEIGSLIRCCVLNY